jgi:hypothetical protein
MSNYSKANLEQLDRSWKQSSLKRQQDMAFALSKEIRSVFCIPSFLHMWFDVRNATESTLLLEAGFSGVEIRGRKKPSQGSFENPSFQLYKRQYACPRWRLKTRNVTQLSRSPAHDHGRICYAHIPSVTSTETPVAMLHPKKIRRSLELQRDSLLQSGSRLVAPHTNARLRYIRPRRSMTVYSGMEQGRIPI